jgi:GT2 family glycosyltransferase
MLSICIVNWNTRELLRACLQSIYRYPPDAPFEVIVVDNASSDGSAAMARTEFPQAVLIANAENSATRGATIRQSSRRRANTSCC